MGVFEKKKEAKNVADEEFICSTAPGSLIWRAGGSGWLLLFPSRHHQQNLPLVSASSSAVLCGLGYFALVQEA